MLQWSQEHPYNGGLAAKLVGPLRLEALRQAVQDTCAFNRLGGMELDTSHQRFEYHPLDEPEWTVVYTDGDIDAALSKHASAELNRPFDRPRTGALRFFAVDGDPQAHYLCVMYDHWAYDAVAARLILRHVLGRYFGVTIPENAQPLKRFAPTYWEAFRNRWSGPGLARAALETARTLARARQAIRITHSDKNALDVGFCVVETAPQTVQHIRALAKANGATFHDVLLAALGKAVAGVVRPRDFRGGRREIALGTIVDTRRNSRRPLNETLGMFLTYHITQCSAEPRSNLARLIQRIVRQTRRIKATSAHLDLLGSIALGRYVQPWLSPRLKRQALRNTLALSAGVSNVTLGGSSYERYFQGMVLQHVRISPTGAVVPIVVAPTTLNGRMNIGITYRLGGLFEADRQQVIDTFLDLIQNPN